MNLDDWRSRINNLDHEILDLLNQRADAALHIGELKRQQGLPYYNSEREAQVLDRLVGLTSGPLTGDAIRAIWREIVSASLALEHPLTVAYLGPPGTFTHQAAVRRFGSSAQLLAVRTIAEIFDEVERSRAELGVVPVENSTDGAVNVTLDRLIDSDVTITGEMTATSRSTSSRGRRARRGELVCSHPQGSPVPRLVAAHLPEALTEETPSTAARWSGRATTRRWPPSPPTSRAGARRADPAWPHRGQPGELHALPPHRTAPSRPPGGTRRPSSFR